MHCPLSLCLPTYSGWPHTPGLRSDQICDKYFNLNTVKHSVSELDGFSCDPANYEIYAWCQRKQLCHRLCSSSQPLSSYIFEKHLRRLGILRVSRNSGLPAFGRKPLALAFVSSLSASAMRRNSFALLRYYPCATRAVPAARSSEVTSPITCAQVV